MTLTYRRIVPAGNRIPGGRRGATALLAAGALLLGACGGADEEDAAAPAGEESQGGPATGGTLTMLRVGTTPTNWDPADPSSDGMSDPGGTGVFLEAVYGVLAYEDYDTGEVVPSLAASISSEDAVTWTLTLQEGVTFTDGTPFDAEAVQFNWERHLEPELTSPQASVVEAIDQLNVVDPITLEVVLKSPNAQFDRVVARSLSFIGSPEAMRSDLDSFRTSPVGAGPFVLVDYLAEQEATFARNPDYWDAPKPYLDELVIRNVADDEQRYNSFIAGEGQVMQVFRGYSHVAEAESNGYQVFTNVPGGGTGLMINHARPPFDDLAAREALSIMFDASLKTDTLDFGVSEPLTNLFPEGSPYYDPSLSLPQFDRERAQQLLDEYAAATGGPLTFKLSQFEGSRDLGELFLAQLQEYENLQVELDLQAANQFVPTLAQGNFDVAVFPFAYGDPVENFRQYLTTDGVLNFGKYSNPDLDQLLTEAESALTVEERVEMFIEIQKLFLEEIPFVFLTNNPDVQLAQESVDGLDHAIDGIPLWDGVSIVG